MILVYDVFFIVFCVSVFAFGGWIAVAPFRRFIAFPLPCSALAGLILVPCTILLIHVVLSIPFWIASLIAIPTLWAASGLAIYIVGWRDLTRQLKVVLVMNAMAALCAALIVTRTDLYFGEPGFLYENGSDHAAYAHQADWIRLKGATLPYGERPLDDYATYPDYSFQKDPRFGSFSLLALISTLSGRPGVFAYDLACAIVLVITTLGVSGIFSRNRLAFVLLAVLLFTSCWFDFNRSGFFAKSLGFPSGVFCVGLFFTFVRLTRVERIWPPSALGSLVVLTACSATLYSAHATALALGLLGSMFLLLSVFWSRQRSLTDLCNEYARLGVLLLALVATAFVASGIVARPLYLEPGDLDVEWEALFRWATQVSVLNQRRPELPLALMYLSATGVTAMWVALAIYAWVSKLPDAVSLALGPALLLVMLYLLDQKWRFYEANGLYFPVAACAAAIVLSNAAETDGVRRAVLAAAFLAIPWGLTLPHFSAALDVFGGRETPPTNRFSQSEIDRLASAIGSSGAIVDVGHNGQIIYFLVVELGRRAIPFELSERSWRTLAKPYRSPDPPDYDKPAPFVIVLRSKENSDSPNLVMRTTQYDLLRRR
jgi:hypothetical protein